ncbi:hypothetical protein [Cryptosporangium phraense]|uniref:Uncharacterized protein n=1 Tax=Cryptosporangium phraense TaxID=2593070 RepID=A0A545AK57_9ACTN|nr:hypothetical protein [Cryptosporangium phraense]TQS41679.1 hypothetical protein FL583_27950 [Cryptosporangium phraense]
MTKGARARARAVREAEAERARRRASRRARRRAILTAPWHAIRALTPGGAARRGRRTGRMRSPRDRAQVSAIVMGLLVAIVVVFLTIDSWALRIGAVVLALLLAPVLLALTRTDYSRRVQ